MNVFIDTNVLLDVLAVREPFYSDSAKVLTLAETGRIKAFASVISLPILFYLLRRTKGREAARKTLSRLRDIVTCVAVDEQVVNQAFDSNIADFEDAIQFFCALRSGATTLVTRNAPDFPSDNIAIQSPAEFLAAHFPPITS